MHFHQLYHNTDGTHTYIPYTYTTYLHMTDKITVSENTPECFTAYLQRLRPLCVF